MHVYGNAFSHVLASKVREVSHMLKAIPTEEARDVATEKASAVVKERRRQRLSGAAELVEQRVGESLTCYDFPDRHWIELRTTTPEQIIREIQRQTRIVSAFPYGQSC